MIYDITVMYVLGVYQPARLVLLDDSLESSYLLLQLGTDLRFALEPQIQYSLLVVEVRLHSKIFLGETLQLILK